MKWPRGPECPKCQSKNIAFLGTRRIFKCRECKKQFSVKVGTIFEDSPIPLDKWLAAFWMIANCKNGISSVNHAETYIAGDVHTNGLEDFWSLLKRSIKGTCVSVEPFHLFRYLDEQVFSYNERKGTDASRFVELCGRIRPQTDLPRVERRTYVTRQDEVEGREAFRRFKRLTKAVLATNLQQIPDQRQEPPKEDNPIEERGDTKPSRS